ncbi:MAG: hypothetical protein JJE13_02055 [Thermoleophilia bacterium]|nr:hypothetical protein [Thermoleophilia bacterium]
MSTAGATAAPLKVKMATFDGKKKVKVARKLKAVTSCSKDCSLHVTFAVRTPAGTIKDSASGTISGNQLIPVNVRLNNVALKYLRSNYRASRCTINVVAKDLETGKRVTKKRSFKFYK